MENLNLKKKLWLEKNYLGANPCTCVKHQEQAITDTVKRGKEEGTIKKYKDWYNY